MTTLFPLPSPTLPDFTTLLVAGPLHASAPIHLCLSHLANRPDSTAVLISPSRQPFLNSLLDLSDDWINECGGFGAVSSLLAKVTSLYPPTPLHLAVVLSMLKVAEHTDEPAFTAKIPLAAPPALIVLNEPSTYLIDEESATLSSYLGIVTMALETIASFGTTTTALVVIDSRLHDLKLPLVEGPGDGGRAYVPRLALELARQYFEWIALVEQDDAASEEQDHRNKSLTLTPAGVEAPEAVLWKWTEASAEQRGFSERAGTTFIWPEDDAL